MRRDDIFPFPGTLCLLALTVIPACGDQAPPEYSGEALAVINGTLAVQRAAPLPEVDVVLAWPDWTNSTDHSTGLFTAIRQPVTATLPARFSLTVVAPPPESAYHPRPPEFTGPRFTDASIVIVKRGATITTLDSDDPNIVEIVNDYHLVYVDATGTLSGPDGQGGTRALWSLTKGFQLTRQAVTFCAQDGIDPDCASQYASTYDSQKTINWLCGKNTATGGTGIPVPADQEIPIQIDDAPYVPADLTEMCPVTF